MTELSPESQERATTASERVKAFISRIALHETVSGYENDDDPIERK